MWNFLIKFFTHVKLCLATAIHSFKSVKYWYLFNPYSAGIDFSRQDLTSADVRLWRLKSIPAL